MKRLPEVIPEMDFSGVGRWTGSGSQADDGGLCDAALGSLGPKTDC